ncbi:hypothetical protein [Microbacterium sp. cx-59]|uniref:hypothetical protein n=1 Tax=Microbacterium sp. cx-59 TaxID=2891207 RepID=UPI001E38D9F9|nr:hypothetical protein [Microbacterium sp. cx-59]MCC4906943.1 hypothetical protein [Microbacterium sp. cx-59]
MRAQGIRIITVKQPYASQIILGGKNVENRVRNIAGQYRGPIAIHAGLGHVPGIVPPSELRALHDGAEAPRGAIIGVVDLRATHHADYCWEALDERGLCTPWALPDNWHLELTNPRALAEPIAFTGALGLRRLDDATASRVWEAIA